MAPVCCFNKGQNWIQVKRMRSEATGSEGIFAKAIFDEGLLSKICKEYLKLNSKKMNKPIKDEQKIWIDVSAKKIYRWRLSMWRETQHHMHDCILKQSWDNTTYLANTYNTK